MSCPGAEERDGRGSRSEGKVSDQSFPRSCRLTLRRQFTAVYEKGRRVASSSIVLFALPNDVGECRLGITVTRKVGGAVERNRIKRVVRDIFRRHRGTMTPALDLVVNAKPRAESASSGELEKEILSCFAELARRFKT